MPLASGPLPPRQREVRTPPRMYQEPETQASPIPAPTRNTDIHYWNRLDFIPKSPQRQGRSPKARHGAVTAKSPQPRPLAHDARTIIPDPPPPKTPPPPPRIFGPSDFVRNHLCPDRRNPLPPSRGGSRSRSVTPESRRRRTRRERQIVRGASPSPMRAERDTGLYTEWIAREMFLVQSLEREVATMEEALAKEFEKMERNEMRLRDLQRAAVVPDMRANDSEKLAEAILAICAYKCFTPSFDASLFDTFVSSTLRSCRGIDPKVEALYQASVRKCSGQSQTSTTVVQGRHKSPESSPEAPVLRAALKVIDEEAAKSSNIRTAIENGFGVVMKRKVHVRVVEEPDPAGGPPKRHVHFSAPDLDEKAAMEAITKAMEQGEAHPEHDVRSLLKMCTPTHINDTPIPQRVPPMSHAPSHQLPSPAVAHAPPHQLPSPAVAHAPPHQLPSPAVAHAPHQLPSPTVAHAPHQLHSPTVAHAPHQLPSPTVAHAPHQLPSPTVAHAPHQLPGSPQRTAAPVRHIEPYEPSNPSSSPVLSPQRNAPAGFRKVHEEHRVEVVQRSPPPGPVGFKRASAVVTDIRNSEHQHPLNGTAPNHAGPTGFRRVGATPQPKASGPVGFRKAGGLPVAKAVFGHKPAAPVGASEQVVHAEYHREAVGVVRADMYHPYYMHTQHWHRKIDLMGHQHSKEPSGRKGPVWPHVYRYPEAQPPPVIDTPIRRGHVTPSTQAQSADQSPSARSYSSTVAVVNPRPSVAAQVDRAVARISRSKEQEVTENEEEGGAERHMPAVEVSMEAKEATGFEEGTPEAVEGTVGEIAPTRRLRPKHGPVEGPPGQRVIHIMKHDLEEVTGVGGFWSSDSSLSDDAEAQLAKKGFRAQADAKKALGIGMSSSVQEQSRRWSGRRASGSVLMRRSSTSSEPMPIWGRKSSR